MNAQMPDDPRARPTSAERFRKKAAFYERKAIKALTSQNRKRCEQVALSYMLLAEKEVEQMNLLTPR